MNANAVPSLFNCTAPVNGLTAHEMTELERCESIIARGWPTFVEVGQALATIRDKKLYRATHKSFEAYCRERWQYRKSYAYYLIGAAEVVADLSTIVDKKESLPANEAQVRPLVGLPPQQVREIWKQATNSGTLNITEKAIRRLVKKHADRNGSRKSKKTSVRGTPASKPDAAKLIGFIEQIEEELNRKKIHRERIRTLCERLKGEIEELEQGVVHQ